MTRIVFLSIFILFEFSRQNQRSSQCCKMRLFAIFSNTVIFFKKKKKCNKRNGQNWEKKEDLLTCSRGMYHLSWKVNFSWFRPTATPPGWCPPEALYLAQTKTSLKRNKCLNLRWPSANSTMNVFFTRCLCNIASILVSILT